MSRRILFLSVLLPLFSFAQRSVSDEEVRRVHSSTLIIDTHSDTTSKTVAGFDIGQRATSGHMDIPRMKEGGLGAQFFAVYVAAGYARNNQSAHRALDDD